MHAHRDLEAAIEARAQLGAEIERTLDTLAYTRNAAFEGSSSNSSSSNRESANVLRSSSASGFSSFSSRSERGYAEGVDADWGGLPWQQRQSMCSTERSGDRLEEELLVASEKERDRLQREENYKDARARLKRQGRWQRSKI